LSALVRDSETCCSSSPGIPIESLALIIGIDRFMSECRALTNFIGNSVATLAISRWEKEISAEKLQTRLREETTVAGGGRP
jgi:aerobic C4-dicarboxylate transport protein